MVCFLEMRGQWPPVRELEGGHLLENKGTEMQLSWFHFLYVNWCNLSWSSQNHKKSFVGAFVHWPEELKIDIELYASIYLQSASNSKYYCTTISKLTIWKPRALFSCCVFLKFAQALFFSPKQYRCEHFHIRKCPNCYKCVHAHPPLSSSLKN